MCYNDTIIIKFSNSVKKLFFYPMDQALTIAELISSGKQYYLPSVSIDNVIFGFHENQLKVLLLQIRSSDNWGLPGGYVFKEEEIEDAAVRVLKSRTGLQDLFLQQFYVFGGTKRVTKEILKPVFKAIGTELTDESWLMNRFISIGYYALVEYEKVTPYPDELSTQCTWHDLNNLPGLILDHKEIIDKALETLRIQVNHQPIGYNLLPDEFPLKSLQLIYETILGRKLDRGNFNRKILGYGILEKKQKHYSGGAHKAPYLYSFLKEDYFNALKTGLKKDF